MRGRDVYRSIITLAVLILLAAAVARPAKAVELESSIGAIATTNLVGDSSNQSASSILGNARVAVFPSPAVRASAEVSRIQFLDSDEYSHTGLNGEAWWLSNTTGKRIGYSLVLRGEARLHSSEQKHYNRYTAAASSGIDFQASDKVSVRATGTGTVVRFPDARSGDRSSVELVFGTNLRPLGLNIIDLRFSGGLHRYRFLDSGFLLVDPDDPSRSLLNGTVLFWSASLRWSRPISSRLGASISATGENVIEPKSRLVFDATTGYLTPWNRLIDRLEGSIRLKSFQIPGAISVLSIEAGRRWFHAAIEDADMRPVETIRRVDDLIRPGLTIDVPILVRPSHLSRIVFNVAYASIESSIARYSTESWDGAIVIKVAM